MHASPGLPPIAANPFALPPIWQPFSGEFSAGRHFRRTFPTGTLSLHLYPQRTLHKFTDQYVNHILFLARFEPTQPSSSLHFVLFARRMVQLRGGRIVNVYHDDSFIRSLLTPEGQPGVVPGIGVDCSEQEIRALEPNIRQQVLQDHALHYVEHAAPMTTKPDLSHILQQMSSMPDGPHLEQQIRLSEPVQARIRAWVQERNLPVQQLLAASSEAEKRVLWAAIYDTVAANAPLSNQHLEARYGLPAAAWHVARQRIDQNIAFAAWAAQELPSLPRFAPTQAGWRQGDAWIPVTLEDEPKSYEYPTSEDIFLLSLYDRDSQSWRGSVAFGWVARPIDHQSTSIANNPEVVVLYEPQFREGQYHPATEQEATRLFEQAWR